ncbi:hypothetical protein L3Q82_003951 [Scortum barcoo]|uniref:Uncharacterized protein n=1 Tax=Scortum barcoo TaxID=214431 RepID=A0ACB8X7F5_9TELE|nr:hypothetical protein L3Q82_003951 [Scortum barcoo]
MHAGLFLLLLALCSGGASENSASLKIQAFAGETAVLPCSISLQNDNPTVEWSKEGLKPDTAFLYRDGCETYEIKNPAFRFRTNLFLEEMKNGNISLRISNLQLSDAGTYICTLVQRMPLEVR